MSAQTESNLPKIDESSIRNCKFEESLVGKAIKSSKRKLRWEFDIEDRRHVIELYDSKLTGKKKVTADFKTVYGPIVMRSLFSISFTLGNTVISIVQNGNTFECRINNFPFNHLAELQRNKRTYTTEGTSPVSRSGKRYTSTVGHELPKFQVNLMSTSENKENASGNKQFNFVIKERKSTAGSSEGSIASSLGNASGVYKQFNTNKYQEFMSKVSSSKNKESVNLIDFGPEGSQPTKVNLLQLGSLSTDLNVDKVENPIPIDNQKKEGRLETSNNLNALFEAFSIQPTQAQPKVETSDNFSHNSVPSFPSRDTLNNLQGGVYPTFEDVNFKSHTPHSLPSANSVINQSNEKVTKPVDIFDMFN